MPGMGIPVGGGTDGTRVSSHDPWGSLRWPTMGSAMGRLRPWDEENAPSREKALDPLTVGGAGFAREEDPEGRLEEGR
jgi:predicted amidohydrolase YtcJ